MARHENLVTPNKIGTFFHETPQPDWTKRNDEEKAVPLPSPSFAVEPLLSRAF